MSDGQWKIRRTREVAEFIAAQEKVPVAQMELDIKKLKTRGVNARHPLVGHYKGDIYYLRSKVEGYGLYRIFYFRDGKRSFLVFYGFKKDTQKIPAREKKKIDARFERIRGKKP